MTGRGKVSVGLALAGMLALIGLTAPGCGGGCAISASNPDLSGTWRGGCGTDANCQVSDDNGSLIIDCTGFGSCNGTACDGEASLDCTSAVDGSEYSGELKVSADGNMITGTLTGGASGPCNLIFQRVGGHPGPG